MLENLITSKTRIRLLLKFFLNPQNNGYLRGLATEFGESTNALRLELNRLENAQMLKSETSGNKKIYRVNPAHPLFEDINNIVKKYYGLDVIIDRVIKKLGALNEVFITGDLAEGKETDVIDLIFIGKIDQYYLSKLLIKAEHLIHRKIRTLVYTNSDWDKVKDRYERTSLLIWSANNKQD